MEPNPYAVPVRRREQPLQAGDVVRYCGPTPSSICGYANNQHDGIIRWCRQGGHAKHGESWRCNVDWSLPKQRDRWCGARFATYLAKNLCRVRSLNGWAWPRPDAFRAEDV